MIIPEEMIQDLAWRFPRGEMKRLPEENPTEVIIDIYRDPDGRYSAEMAIIARSRPHHHQEITQVYLVIDGSIELFEGGEMRVSGRRVDSKSGPQIIFPRKVHYAEAVDRPATVLIVSTPARSVTDHWVLAPGY